MKELDNAFLKGIKNETNETLTENGAIAYKTTNSALLDLFAVIGALRSRPSQEIIDKFTKAFAEDKLLAMKMLFYARNIRGGLGERKTFRILIKYMATYHTEIMEKNLELIPIFGRWDDLYELVGTPLEDTMFNLISIQLKNDLANLGKNKQISLLAKWLKSARWVKSVSRVSIKNAKLGRLTAKKLNLSYKQYRQILSKLREQLNIVERNMSKDEWDKIVYREVPSLAMKKYRDAFKEHNLVEFKKYIEKVKKGEEKIKADTLYPYNIMEAADLGSQGWSGNYKLEKWDEVLEEQWKALPNYVEGENNILIMADTSGSMEGRPVCTSIGLAIYFAERNKGPWHNQFLTFASKPSFIELKGTNLAEKVRCIPNICDNTNIEAAFDLVLDVAIKNNLSQEELPKAIVIISDMEFDEATGEYCWTIDQKERLVAENNKIMDKIAYDFQQAGYTIPKVIYWNADSRQDTYHAISENKNVAMVSGQSVSTFKTVLMSIDEKPYDVMLKTLNDPIYDVVRI